MIFIHGEGRGRVFQSRQAQLLIPIITPRTTVAGESAPLLRIDNTEIFLQTGAVIELTCYVLSGSVETTCQCFNPSQKHILCFKWEKNPAWRPPRDSVKCG